MIWDQNLYTKSLWIVDVLTASKYCTTVLYVFGFGIMYLDFGIGLLKTDKVILNTSN